MSELPRDEFGWPIRMVNGERLCARPDCKEDEFRIDGYCSMLCRDGDEYEQEIARFKALLKEACKIAFCYALDAADEVRFCELQKEAE